MNKKVICGVDEVGRGPLAGPVVAAAVILQKDHGIIGLNDSKKLTPKKRESLYQEIKNKSISFGLGCVGIEVIDKINIRNATHLAMERAINKLKLIPEKILIDGREVPKSIINGESILKGDTKIEEIMAASIVAKVSRDKMMVNYSIIFPEYGFEKHKGYGTKMHMQAIKENMATPIHRKSFNPVRKYLPTLSWLKENKKIRWMAQKLSALHLQEINYTINTIDVVIDNRVLVDLIAYKDEINVFVFINLVNDPSYDINLNSTIKTDQSIKETISNFIIENNMITGRHWRIDTLNVDLFNKTSKFKYFEGKVNNN